MREVDVQKKYNDVAFGSVCNTDCRMRAEMACGWISPGMSILDVGCRHGEALSTFSKRFPTSRVCGIDLVEEFVNVATTRGFEAIVGDIRSLPFDDLEWDWTFCSHTLEHVPDLELAIRELKRVSKCGIFIAVPLEVAGVSPDNPSHHHYISTIEGWARELEDRVWEVAHSRLCGEYIAVLMRREDV